MGGTSRDDVCTGSRVAPPEQVTRLRTEHLSPWIVAIP